MAVAVDHPDLDEERPTKVSATEVYEMAVSSVLSPRAQPAHRPTSRARVCIFHLLDRMGLGFFVCVFCVFFFYSYTQFGSFELTILLPHSAVVLMLCFHSPCFYIPSSRFSLSLSLSLSLFLSLFLSFSLAQSSGRITAPAHLLCASLAGRARRCTTAT